MERPQPVANFRFRREAEMASGILANVGIPYVIQSGEGSGYGPLPGGSSLLVRSDHVERARTILEEAGVIEETEGGGSALKEMNHE